MSRKNAHIELTDWDWTTLVAAWRYYEHRSTAASAKFPADIVRRFFGSGSPYSDSARMAIAHQFAKTDHGLRGEEDWTAEIWRMWECDKLPWTKFYRFCDGYVDGFQRVTFRYTDKRGMERRKTVEAFEVVWKCRRYPVAEYVASPWLEQYIDEDAIVRIEL